jgi:plastocyanin
MKKALVLLAVSIAALGIVACGGDDDDTDTGAASAPASTEATGGGGGAAGGGETLKVTADASGQLAWSPTELSAKAGQVTIELDNPASVAHNIELEGGGVEELSDTVSQSTTSISADLKPGTYTYFCNVPGHREAGMEGTLTVK